jgi:hypothetical protein
MEAQNFSRILCICEIERRRPISSYKTYDKHMEILLYDKYIEYFFSFPEINFEKNKIESKT